MTSYDVVFRFGNKEAAAQFLIWMSESGEQQYWDWMDYREGEEDGDITVLGFDVDDYENPSIVDATRCGRHDTQ